ncbi:putative udp-glucosyl transferase family protein [Diplodia seriata]|uniref:Putative udp-glucosyl transferase family protein n=1 Tax=Diplodia seriata TaxID=420778 RepID=A0A0G2E178_9PEZI|nr:putative udp-glucosyl transferase family protein [Diplodia seriata]
MATSGDDDGFKRKILLLSTVGGYTHAAPILELGAVLAARGHTITFATNAGQEHWARTFPFISAIHTLGPAVPASVDDAIFERSYAWSATSPSSLAAIFAAKRTMDAAAWPDAHARLRRLCAAPATRPDFIVADYFSDAAATDMLRECGVPVAVVWPQFPFAARGAKPRYVPGVPGFQPVPATTSERLGVWDRLRNEAVLLWALPHGKEVETTVGDVVDNKHEEFLVLPFAPQRAVLEHPHTTLFLTHAGGSSANEAAWHGVRVLCLPVWFDQLANAERLAEAGVGLQLDKFAFDSGDVVGKIETVMRDGDGMFAKNVQRLKRIARIAAKGKHRAADLIEEVLADWEGGAGNGDRAMHLQTADCRMSVWKARNWDLMAVVMGITATSGGLTWWGYRPPAYSGTNCAVYASFLPNPSTPFLIEPNPDISGIGVLLAFIITAYATLLFTICAYWTGLVPDELLNVIDKRVFGATSRRATSPWSKAFRGALRACSDQQMVTGIAVIAAAFAGIQTVSVYHWRTVIYLGWMSSNVHLNTLTVAMTPHWNRKGRSRGATAARFVRLAGMLTLFALLVAALVPTVSQSFNNALANHPADGYYWYADIYYYAFLFTPADPIFCFWLPEYSAEAAMWRQRKGRFVRIMTAWPYATLVGTYAMSVAVLDFAASFFASLTMLTISLAWGTLNLLMPRQAFAEFIGPDENTWNFGQVLPMLLLLLPVVSVVEEFSVATHHEEGQGEVVSHPNLVWLTLVGIVLATVWVFVMQSFNVANGLGEDQVVFNAGLASVVVTALMLIWIAVGSSFSSVDKLL